MRKTAVGEPLSKLEAQFARRSLRQLPLGHLIKHGNRIGKALIHLPLARKSNLRLGMPFQEMLG